MEHNKKIVIAFALVFLAGMIFGYGAGASYQYQVIENYLVLHANTDKLIQLPGENFFSIEKMNVAEVNISSPSWPGGK